MTAFAGKFGGVTHSRAVGNAGEIFVRDLGEGADLKLPRGANALWTQGGLIVPEAPH